MQHKKNCNPPRWLILFFSWFCHPDHLEDLEGDLRERYDQRHRDVGKRKADWLFFLDVFSLFRPAFIRPIKSNHPINIFDMWKHNLIMTLRNFKRSKTSFLINLLSLSSGLACAILIYLWVVDELKVDSFHEKGDRLYQVMELWEYPDRTDMITATQGPLAKALSDNIPEIEHALAIVDWIEDYQLTVEDKNTQAKGFYVGPEFFDVLSYDLLKGSKDNVFEDVNNVVLSKKTAEQLFGSIENAVGQSVEVNHQALFRVGGIVENPPSNSTYQFDFLIHFEKFREYFSWVNSWTNHGPATLVTLNEGADHKVVTEKINNFYKTTIDKQKVKYKLLSFPDQYLYSRYENGEIVGGRIEYVRLFSFIGLLIIVIACINFMNMATARASRHAKSIGVKKTIGARRRVIISQYLTESLLLTALSTTLAIFFVRWVLPQFNLLIGKEISFQLSLSFILVLLGITLATGLLAGSYPALYLSSFKPVDVLKGDIKASWREFFVRRGLVIFQFTMTIVLMIGVLTIYRQIQFVQSKNLGYDKNQVIHFNLNGELPKQYNTLLTEAERNPEIKAVSRGQQLINHGSSTIEVAWDGHNPEEMIAFHNFNVDYGFLQTLGIKLLEGRHFSKKFGTEQGKVIFNEKAIEIMGMEDPIGKQVTIWKDFQFEIVGIAEDFHFRSLHTAIEPVFFIIYPENAQEVFVKLEKGKEQEAIQKLESLTERLDPNYIFDFNYLDEEYAQLYAAEQRVESLARYFAGFALFISCLGLFGLVIFTADRRKKEIGIRKILGATSMSIVYLFSKEFTRLVLISIVIGSPIAYFLSKNWLEKFTYKIDLSLWYFLGVGLVVLLIALLTISSQALKSAYVNPKDYLREE